MFNLTYSTPSEIKGKIKCARSEHGPANNKFPKIERGKFTDQDGNCWIVYGYGHFQGMSIAWARPYFEPCYDYLVKYDPYELIVEN